MSSNRYDRLPDYCGIGLRSHHYPEWHGREDVPLLEVMADNYIYQAGGPALGHLDRIVEKAPVVMHSVGMNIGGSTDIDMEFVSELRKLALRIGPQVVSDHLCFTSASVGSSFDLLPIIRCEENLLRIAERVKRVQDALGYQLCLENVSAYVSYVNDEMSEMEFMQELCQRTGCGVLLDVNNIYVSAVNFGHDAWSEITRIDSEFVKQYHVAGHSQENGFLVDTHDEKVCGDVWELLARTLDYHGKRPLILERDDELALAPQVDELVNGMGLVEAFRSTHVEGLHATRRD